MRRLTDQRGAIEFINADAEQTSPTESCPRCDRSASLPGFMPVKTAHCCRVQQLLCRHVRAIPSAASAGLYCAKRHVLAALEWLYLRFLKVRPRLQRMFAD
jgi:uncharacterized paraquat-inducible protein A